METNPAPSPLVNTRSPSSPLSLCTQQINKHPNPLHSLPDSLLHFLRPPRTLVRPKDETAQPQHVLDPPPPSSTSSPSSSRRPLSSFKRPLPQDQGKTHRLNTSKEALPRRDQCSPYRHSRSLQSPADSPSVRVVVKQQRPRWRSEGRGLGHGRRGRRRLLGGGGEAGEGERQGFNQVSSQREGEGKEEADVELRSTRSFRSVLTDFPTLNARLSG